MWVPVLGKLSMHVQLGEEVLQLLVAEVSTLVSIVDFEAELKVGFGVLEVFLDVKLLHTFTAVDLSEES